VLRKASTGVAPDSSSAPSAEAVNADGEASDAEEDGSARRRDLKEEAKSVRHLMTHLPKNPYCKARQRAKMIQVSAAETEGLRVMRQKPDNLAIM
jgi:hypothetical protein